MGRGLGVASNILKRRKSGQFGLQHLMGVQLLRRHPLKLVDDSFVGALAAAKCAQSYVANFGKKKTCLGSKVPNRTNGYAINEAMERRGASKKALFRRVFSAMRTSIQKHKDRKLRESCVPGLSVARLGENLKASSQDGFSDEQKTYFEERDHQRFGCTGTKREKKRKAGGANIYEPTCDKIRAVAKAVAKAKSQASMIKAVRDQSFFTDTNVFYPSGVSRPLAGSEHLKGFACVLDVGLASCLLVECNSRGNTKITRIDALGASVKLFQHDIFAARLLCMRLITRKYMELNRNVCVESDQSLKYHAAVGKGCKLLWVFSIFRDRHMPTMKLLERAVLLPMNNWRMVKTDAELAALRTVKKNTTPITEVRCLTDIHNVVETCSAVDAPRTGKGTFQSC